MDVKEIRLDDDTGDAVTPNVPSITAHDSWWLTSLVLTVIMLTLACAGGPAATPADRLNPTAATVVSAETVPQEDEYPFSVVRVDFLVPPSPGGGAVKPGGRFARLLDSIPDTPEARLQVWLNDFGYLWSFFDEHGVSRPRRDDPSDAVVEALRIVLSQGSSLEIGEMMPFPESAPWIAGGLGTDYPTKYLFHAASGVDARNVDAAAKTGPGNAHRGLNKGREELAVLFGDYDPGTILSKLKSCAECLPPDTRGYSGVEYMAWGEDFEPNLRSRFKPPWFDSLGRGGRVAIFDGKLVQARATDGIETLIDVQTGQRPSLWDDPSIAAAGRVLESLGVYRAVVSAADFSEAGLLDHLARRCVGEKGYGSSDFAEYAQCPMSPAGSEAAAGETVGIDVVGTAPLLKPFNAAAFGLVPRRDPDTTQTIIVLVHGDETSARQNSDLLLKRLAQTSLSDGSLLYAARVQKVELHIDRAVLTARLTLGPKSGMDYLTPGALIDLPLTVHE